MLYILVYPREQHKQFKFFGNIPSLFTMKLSRHCSEKLVLMSCIVTVILVLLCLAATLFLNFILEIVSLTRIQSYFDCDNRPLDKLIYQHGEYWVLSNYVRAGMPRGIGCSSTTTLTLQGNYADIYKMEKMYIVHDPNPVATSFAVYVPDQLHLNRTLQAIYYIRNCINLRVLDVINFLVTFHIYFPLGTNLTFLPRQRAEYSKDIWLRCVRYSRVPNDSKILSTATEFHEDIQKSIIVGRNIAQLMAPTKYLLPLDGVTYPSVNLMATLIGEMSMLSYCNAEVNTEKIIMRLPVVAVDNIRDGDHTSRLSRHSLLNSLENLQHFHLEQEDPFDTMRSLSDGSLKDYCRALSSFEDNLKALMNYPTYFLGTWNTPLLEENHNLSVVKSENLRIYNLLQQGYKFMVPLDIFVLHNISQALVGMAHEASKFDPALMQQYNVMFRDPNIGNDYVNSQVE